MIIGDAAVNVHGYTRAAEDLDIWYNPSAENFKMLIRSIGDFGFDTTPLGNLESYDSKGFIRLPVEPFFIELLAIIDGKLDFEYTYKKAIQFDFHGISVPVIGYDELIKTKLCQGGQKIWRTSLNSKKEEARNTSSLPGT